MRQQKVDLQYLYNVARNMMGMTKVMYHVTHGIPVDGGSFQRCFQSDVESILRSWSNERLGAIAALGRGGGHVTCNPVEVAQEDRETESRFGVSHRATLTDVHLGKAMTEYMSGKRLLLVLASLTIVAAMLDLVRNHNIKVDRKADDARAAFAVAGFNCISAR